MRPIIWANIVSSKYVKEENVKEKLIKRSRAKTEGELSRNTVDSDELSESENRKEELFRNDPALRAINSDFSE